MRKGSKGIFVTGTDTGVGKTIISAALALTLKEEGLDVGVMKPIESGALPSKEGLLPQDALFLREVSGVKDPLELLNPYRFEAPLAPAPASSLVGKEIDLEKIKEAFHKLSSRHQVVVVEGVGGLLVPLSDKVLLPQLIKLLGIPLLLVARASLGTINHTLLSLYYCKREGMKVIGFILNRSSDEDDPSQRDNPHYISLFTDIPYLGTFPFLKGRSTRNPSSLSQAFREGIDLSFILDALGA